jgi:hypothetical protein
VDIHYLGSTRLTWRRLRVLLEGLPEDSSFIAAISGLSVEQRFWTMDRQLAAGISDKLSWVMYLTGALVAQNSPKMKQNPVPEPKPIERPGVTADKGRTGKGMRSLVRALGAPV